MHLLPLLLLPAVSLAASSAPQLFLSPPPSHSSQITLTAPQANAVLAHHLGVSQYETLPKSGYGKGAKDWEQLLTDSADGGEGRKVVVVVVECPSSGCDDIVPPTLHTQHPIVLPSLPTHSWTSLVTLHLHRLATSLGLDLSSTSTSQVWGLDELIKGIKQVAGWASWVGDELGGRIGWDAIKDSFKSLPIPTHSKSPLLTDLDFGAMDSSTHLLVQELEKLSTLIDSFEASNGLEGEDAGPQGQGEGPKVIAMHFKGFANLDPTSSSYAPLCAVLRASLSSLLAKTHPEEDQAILLTLPPYTPPLLRKRQPFLKAFEGHQARYAKRAAASGGELRKRGLATEVDKYAGDGMKAKRAEKTPVPIIPSTSTCFTSASDVYNQTANCEGRGTAVSGVSALSGADCWVCSCDKGYAGQGCEKVDLSSEFTLLFFSSAGLLLILFVSVMLLAKVGSVELPSVLASLGGQGVKRE